MRGMGRGGGGGLTLTPSRESLSVWNTSSLHFCSGRRELQLLQQRVRASTQAHAWKSRRAAATFLEYLRWMRALAASRMTEGMAKNGI